MKVTIVGAGNVGATAADVIASKEIAQDIVLLDICLLYTSPSPRD